MTSAGIPPSTLASPTLNYPVDEDAISNLTTDEITEVISLWPRDRVKPVTPTKTTPKKSKSMRKKKSRKSGKKKTVSKKKKSKSVESSSVVTARVPPRGSRLSHPYYHSGESVTLPLNLVYRILDEKQQELLVNMNYLPMKKFT